MVNCKLYDILQFNYYYYYSWKGKEHFITDEGGREVTLFTGKFDQKAITKDLSFTNLLAIMDLKGSCPLHLPASRFHFIDNPQICYPTCKILIEYICLTMETWRSI